MQKLIKFTFLSIIFSGIAYAYYFELNYFFLRFIALLSNALFYIFIVSYLFVNFKQKGGSVPRLNLLFFYILATLIIFIVSININVKDLITILFHPLAFGAFFIGVVAFLVNQKSIIYILKISYYINNLLPFITLIDVIFFQFPVFLITCHSFLLFEYCFASKKRNIYLLISMMVSIILFFRYDYRSGALLTILFLGVISLVYFFKVFKSKIIRASFLLISLFIIYFLSFNFTQVFQIGSSYISDNRISTVDTRTFLFFEFFEDFKPSEYFFGRGYIGTYYSSYFDVWAGDNANRFVVEVGFIQVLFKGGLLLLISTILIFINSIIKGLFKNNTNSVNFLLSFLLLIELGMFSIQNIPSFSPHFLLIWIIIGILNSNFNKPEKTIQ